MFIVFTSFHFWLTILRRKVSSATIIVILSRLRESSDCFEFATSTVQEVLVVENKPIGSNMKYNGYFVLSEYV